MEQRADVAVLTGSRLRASQLGSLAEEFGALARRCAPLVSADFLPNEATVMTYRGEGSGIGPHLDRRRYRELVAIFSIAGRARLDLVADREGRELLRGWDCRPGDLVVLRAPGLGGVADGRPLHRVIGPARGSRTSISLRADSVGAETAWGAEP